MWWRCVALLLLISGLTHAFPGLKWRRSAHLPPIMLRRWDTNEPVIAVAESELPSLLGLDGNDSDDDGRRVLTVARRLRRSQPTDIYTDEFSVDPFDNGPISFRP